MNVTHVQKALGLMVTAFPGLHFDFHGHNDYNMACANALAAVECGVHGIHCTINGLGERAGNLDLAQFAVAVKDFSRRGLHIVEKELHHASRLLEALSGKGVPGTLLSSAVMFLPRHAASVQTVTAKEICTVTNCCLKGSSDSGIMLWASFPERLPSIKLLI
jgi:hypothetical protein